jgi:hypothetical protein
MARTVREASLATRSARLRLAVASKPYWRVIEQGLHLGYRRRATGGSWIARRRNDEGIYRETKLALADDLQDANGDSILDFSQRASAGDVILRAIPEKTRHRHPRAGATCLSIASMTCAL